jgi:hypothetical protein
MIGKPRGGPAQRGNRPSETILRHAGGIIVVPLAGLAGAAAFRFGENPASKNLLLGGNSETGMLTLSSNIAGSVVQHRWKRAGPSHAKARPRRYVDATIETIETAKIGVGSGRSFRVHLVSENMDFRLAPLGCAEQVLDRDPGRLRTEARFGKSFWGNFGRAKDFPRAIRFEPSIAVKRERLGSGAHMANPAPNATGRKQRTKTIACNCDSITVACYLCNTRPKTRSRAVS